VYAACGQMANSALSPWHQLKAEADCACSHVDNPSIIKRLLFSFHMATATLIDCTPSSERFFQLFTISVALAANFLSFYLLFMQQCHYFTQWLDHCRRKIVNSHDFYVALRLICCALPSAPRTRCCSLQEVCFRLARTHVDNGFKVITN